MKRRKFGELAQVVRGIAAVQPLIWEQAEVATSLWANAAYE
jgi:hypothetical protein